MIIRVGSYEQFCVPTNSLICVSGKLCFFNGTYTCINHANYTLYVLFVYTKICGYHPLFNAYTGYTIHKYMHVDWVCSLRPTVI